MNKSTTILIHGAWHGSWCWNKVAPLLEKTGRRVLCPDLAGHGNNVHSFKNINLQTYVEDICSLIMLQPTPVTLVGHSFAGVIISQVAEKIPQKIERLVYVAAFIPINNSSLSLEAVQSRVSVTQTLLRADPDRNEMLVDLTDPQKIKNIFFNTCTIDTFKYAFKKLQTEPLRPMVDTVQLSERHFGRVKKSAILCLQDNAVDIVNQRRMAENANITDITELDCDHSPFFSLPESLCSFL